VLSKRRYALAAESDAIVELFVGGLGARAVPVPVPVPVARRPRARRAPRARKGKP
jgi:hypothetical protein